MHADDFVTLVSSFERFWTDINEVTFGRAIAPSNFIVSNENTDLFRALSSLNDLVFFSIEFWYIFFYCMATS